MICHRPASDSKLTLYLMHHAGGSHSTFRPWLAHLPEDWEVRLVVAPGRPKAARHPAERRLTVISDALAAELLDREEGPYALFGHSMGGLVAFAAALEVRHKGGPAPAWVGVSGHPGPYFSITRSNPPLYGLSPDGLRRALSDLGGLPDRILRDPLLWERVQPLVRADLEAAETWEPDPTPPPVLNLPLSAFCGDQDPVAGERDAAHWGRHTTDFLGVRQFPGGHFYFLDDPEPLVKRIVDDIRSVLPGREPRR
ncbi:alpha/beta fold hydrolase [Streptomyces mayteni]